MILHNITEVEVIESKTTKPVKDCCTVGNTEIVDRKEYLIRCKVCGNEATLDKEKFELMEAMLAIIEIGDKILVS